MNILITGSKGFIGKNLVVSLQNIKDGKLKNSPLSADINLLEFNIDSEQNLLDEFCKIADVVVHLAGINRPLNPEEFMQGNFSFTEQVLKTLKKYDSKASFIITSSIQADLDNLYGLSKKAAENLIMEYSKNNNVDVMIYRLPNVFGKWCKPNYNSVVATFCYNIANNLPITINNTRTELTL
ncbi:MAG: NAD-dependent epimerase/dehydratase family protein, partial [Christensenellaceae bacterium]|nr:NAD-dependent epimerase/dehydratase family protein [Christensenellaceae bacterium]